jgi:hypothetical protein
MGATRWQVIRRVMLPSLIPYSDHGFRTGLGYSWRVVITAEMVGVPKGIGYMLAVGRSTGHTEITIVTMITPGPHDADCGGAGFCAARKDGRSSWRRTGDCVGGFLVHQRKNHKSEEAGYNRSNNIETVCAVTA